jgi:four helix bundle protein
MRRWRRFREPRQLLRDDKNAKFKMQNAKESQIAEFDHDPSEIRDRTFRFAVRVVRVCQHLDTLKGSAWTLSRQLLRAGTSIGANLEEAKAAHSRADFICKAEISLKEARETVYWLRLIMAAEVLPSSRIVELQSEADEIARALGAIVVSAKSHMPHSR